VEDTSTYIPVLKQPTRTRMKELRVERHVGHGVGALENVKLFGDRKSGPEVEWSVGEFVVDFLSGDVTNPPR
jgi:hypothetical protein